MSKTCKYPICRVRQNEIAPLVTELYRLGFVLLGQPLEDALENNLVETARYIYVDTDEDDIAKIWTEGSSGISESMLQKDVAQSIEEYNLTLVNSPAQMINYLLSSKLAPVAPAL